MTALNVAITDNDSAAGRLDNDISLTTFLKEFATALTPTGAFFGCLAGSAPADRFGRRLSVLFTSVLFILGTLAWYVFFFLHHFQSYFIHQHTHTHTLQRTSVY